MTSTALFRADATAETGSGHLVRCATLAASMISRGWQCMLVGNIEGDFGWSWGGDQAIEIVDLAPGAEITDPGPWNRNDVDLLVVDHYGIGAEFESDCRPWARRILAIDDLADRPHDVDFILDQGYGRQPAHYRDLVPEGCGLLLGTEFALLRPEFAAARPAVLDRRRRTRSLNRVFVSGGSSDPCGFVAVALEAIERWGCPVAVDVVLASTAPTLELVHSRAAAMGEQVRVHVDIPAGDLVVLMTDADLAIGAGGIASWERCCLGLPAIALVTAENQWPVVESLSATGAIELLGSADAVGSEPLAEAIAALAKDTGRLRDMALAAAALCDGGGAARVAAAVEG